jgi:hypothetical protein
MNAITFVTVIWFYFVCGLDIFAMLSLFCMEIYASTILSVFILPSNLRMKLMDFHELCYEYNDISGHTAFVLSVYLSSLKLVWWP